MTDTAETASTFVLYRHLTGWGLEYRWRLKDADGHTLARSGSGYLQKAYCEREMTLARVSYPGATVRDLTAAG
jgi:uncharacterized protein YegP (UPF0339 family)